jgi:hypothetical protein
MRCLLLVSALISALLLSARESRGADAKSDLGDNAALQYWQAVALLPAYDKEQDKLLEHWKDAPVDAATLKLLESSRTSLMYVQRATRKPHCDWGLDYSDGLELLMPHLSKLRNLARLSLLDARHEFSRKHWQAGAAEASSMFIVARHAGQEPVLIAILVGNAIDQMAIECLALHLPEMDEAALKTVSARLDGLPASAGLVQKALLKEKQIGCECLLPKMEEAEHQKAGSWRDVLTRYASEADKARLKDLHEYDEALKFSRELLPVYDRMAELAALPRAEFARQYGDLAKKIRATNPLAHLMLPALDKFRDGQDRHDARVALLKAAIAVVQGGPDALKQIRDPFGDGPFEYRRLDKGFELKSKLVVNGQQISLAIGKGE